MDIQVEEAPFDDFEAMMEIEKQCFLSEAFSRQQVAYLLRDCCSISLVAKVCGEVVGFVIVQLEDYEGVVFGHVVTLSVVVGFRRMGIAQKLLFSCEGLLRLRGVVECYLEVRQTNFAALMLYKRLGYVEVGLLKRYYGGKEHGLCLKKSF